MATSGIPQAGQESANAGQTPDPLQEFRQLAQAVQAIGQKYQEASQEAAAMLKLIQQMMVKVSGNAQRTPEKQAPPVA